MSKPEFHRREELLVQRQVPRAWGYEIWIVNNEQYCGKILHIKQGKGTSLHFHDKKTETMYVEEGAIEFFWVDPATGQELSEVLCADESVDIPRLCPHRVVALEEADIFEFSTQHFEEDSFRVRPRIA
jgi:mannose-6-phosphate isomerase-like protein (cupin superfamily)